MRAHKDENKIVFPYQMNPLKLNFAASPQENGS